MKIGILTHRQHANYGGILQCYALLTYLRKIGHEPIVLRREENRSFIIWRITRLILQFLHFPRYYHPQAVDKTKNIRPFVESNIKRTAPLYSSRQLRKTCRKFCLDAVIVGSDQVWRTSSAMKCGYDYFLEFVPDNVVKISYAASFGLSSWDYNSEQTSKISQLLRRFKTISVREEEAISLLKENAGIDSIQVLDPTLLLEKEDYDFICSPRLVNEKYIFVYWLGNKDEMNEIIKHKIGGNNKQVVIVKLRDNIEQISVQDWLSYIKYSDEVVTDSFHGCAFSIIFKRPFEVYENQLGGNGRIRSLLKTIGINQMSVNANDYFFVDKQLLKEKEISKLFIKNNLQ